MKRSIGAALAAGLLVAGAVSAQPDAGGRPGPYAGFDAHNVRDPAERLVLCDATAFLASQPDLNADRMWVRRDDRAPQMLAPPYFIGSGRWYKEGYERLFWRLRDKGQVSQDEVYRLQDTLSRRFIDAYRGINGYGGGSNEIGFLRRQDGACRAWARREGEIIL